MPGLPPPFDAVPPVSTQISVSLGIDFQKKMCYFFSIEKL